MSVMASQVASLTDSGVSTSRRRGLAAWTNSEIVPSLFSAPSSRAFQPSRCAEVGREEVDAVRGRRAR